MTLGQKKVNKSDLIFEHVEKSDYKRPQTIQDLIDNRDILFNIITEILNEGNKHEKRKNV